MLKKNRKHFAPKIPTARRIPAGSAANPSSSQPVTESSSQATVSKPTTTSAEEWNETVVDSNEGAAVDSNSTQISNPPNTLDADKLNNISQSTLDTPAIASPKDALKRKSIDEDSTQDEVQQSKKIRVAAPISNAIPAPRSSAGQDITTPTASEAALEQPQIQINITQSNDSINKPDTFLGPSDHSRATNGTSSEPDASISPSNQEASFSVEPIDRDVSETTLQEAARELCPEQLQVHAEQHTPASIDASNLDPHEKTQASASAGLTTPPVSNTAVEHTSEAPELTAQSGQAKPKARRAPRKKKKAQDTGGADQDESQTRSESANLSIPATPESISDSGQSTAKRRRLPKKQQRQPISDTNTPEGTVQEAAGEETSQNEQQAIARQRKKRASTPEGAEDVVLDHLTVTMADLCEDPGVGKKFSKHDEIKKRHQQRRIQNQTDANETPDNGGDGDRDPGSAGAGSPEAQAESNSGPQMRVIDGQIVIDNNSLQVDRHAQAQAQNLVLEEVEENEFTRLVNSGTYMKKEKSKAWNVLETEQFYLGLSKFGTNFEFIAKMFPHRSRIQVKAKFIAEDKRNSAKITRALHPDSRIAIDLDEYTALSNIKFEEVKDIEAQARAIEEQQEAEQAARADEIAEATRKKKEAIQASGKGMIPGGSNSAKENDATSGSHDREASAAPRSKGKKGAESKNKKNKHSSNGGGEAVEILGSI